MTLMHFYMKGLSIKGKIYYSLKLTAIQESAFATEKPLKIFRSDTIVFIKNCNLFQLLCLSVVAISPFMIQMFINVAIMTDFLIEWSYVLVEETLGVAKTMNIMGGNVLIAQHAIHVGNGYLFFCFYVQIQFWQVSKQCFFLLK